MRVVTRSGCGHRRQVSQRSLLDLWEGPYVVMARLSEVKYTFLKVSNPSRVTFLHFDMLKRYDEETLRPEETLARNDRHPTGQLMFLMLRRCTLKTRRFGQTIGMDSTMIPAQGRNFLRKCREEIE